MSFKRRLIEGGGDTLKNCMQCGTCSVTCPISPEKDPFPRKELLWAQWGLKDRLMSDPDLWLCHQCNDCARLCPREANPGDVMAVARQSAIEHYATPSVLARLVASPKGLPILLAIPAVLMLIAIAVTGGFSAGEATGHGHFFANGIFAAGGEGFKLPVDFDHFFAHYPIIIFFTGLTGLAMLGAVLGLVRFWKAMEASTPGDPAAKQGSIASAAIETIKDILTHKKFTECEATKTRYWGHMLVFYGFVAMFITTTLAAILYYVPAVKYPFEFWNPVKLLGNLGGLAALAGLVMMIVERSKNENITPRSGYSDWLFIVVIGLTVLTGIVCQAARLAGAPVAAYGWYFVHLLMVFFLLVYLPYSKFAHLFYRTVAMIYSRYSGRETVVAAPPQETETEAEQTPEQTAA